MSPEVDVRDDPGHPEGGHALIVFRGATGPAGPARLTIEPLTEGYTYPGPRQIDTVGQATEEGLQYAVGGGQLDRLEAGIAAALSIEGTDLEAELLWPRLTPMRAAPRRLPVKSSGQRRVVVGGGQDAERPATLVANRPAGTPHVVDQGLGEASSQARESTAARPLMTEQAGRDRIDVTPERKAPDAQPLRMPERLVSELPADQGTAQDRPDLDRREPRRQWAALAAAALLGCGAGAAAVGAVWFTRPGPQPVTLTADVSLPSPYAMLHDLSDRSPRGTRVEMGDWTTFLARSRSSGGTAEESSFWRKWAARALLETKANGAAATLSDFATDLARAHVDQPTFAAARFLWEMAAIAEDCSAMDNIAAATAADSTAAVSDQAKTWHERARQCRDRTTPGH